MPTARYCSTRPSFLFSPGHAWIPAWRVNGWRPGTIVGRNSMMQRAKQAEASVGKSTHIEAQCAAKGMRMTEQRRVIARVLADAADHPDVEELHRRCAEIDSRISIS